MNQSPINTQFNFDKKYFDTFKARFLPSEGSFDFVERQILPQDFLDFVLESTSCLKEELEKITKYINDDDNEVVTQKFHLRVLELLMIFGLSFSNNDYLDYKLLKKHRDIVEEDLLIVLEEEENSKENSSKEGYFSDRLVDTINFLNKIIKSSIFILNVEGEVKTICVDNGYLYKAPIILVYSKTRARLLLPSCFTYYSQGLTIKSKQRIQVEQEEEEEEERREKDKNQHKFYSICEYRLVEDHWVAHFDVSDQVEISKRIYEITKEKNANKEEKKKELSIREDLLSFDFESYIDKNLVLVGLIGHCDDVFRKMGFDVHLSSNHVENYPPGFLPRNRLHPELVLYLTNETIGPDHNKSHFGYIFLFIPFFNSQLSSPKSTSPASPTFEEATADAYMRMKSYCSQVVLIKRTQEDKDIEKYYYLQSYVFIYGRANKKKLIDKSRNKENVETYFFGSGETMNYVEIKDESFKKNDFNNEAIGTLKSKKEEIEFESLRHFIQWVEWESKVRTISFDLEEFKSNDINTGIRSPLGEITFSRENKKRKRFHERTEDTNISCEISSEIFGIIHQHLIKNISSSKKKNNEDKPMLYIKKLVAFEDGKLKVEIENESTGKRNTYKFFQICQSPSKIAIPGYFNKIAILRSIESEFSLLNSWYTNDNVLITLFYSEHEKKVNVIVIRQHYEDRTLPNPIFEVGSDYSNQTFSMCRTSKFYSSYNNKTRLLLFTIVKDGLAKVVNVILNPYYTGISNWNTRNLDNFIPLEAKDENFNMMQQEGNQKRNQTNEKRSQRLSCFPEKNGKDHEVRFTGFTMNESGNEAVMNFNCFIQIDPKERRNNTNENNNNDKPLQRMSGRFHYYVFFNPINLTPLKTIKLDSDTFNTLYAKEIEEQSSKGNYDRNIAIRLSSNFSSNFNNSVSFPILYVNNSLLLFIYFNSPPESLSLLIIGNIKDTTAGTFNNIDKLTFNYPSSTITFFEGSDLFEVAKNIRHTGIFQTEYSYEYLYMENTLANRPPPPQVDNDPNDESNSIYGMNPSPVRMNHLTHRFIRNKIDLLKKKGFKGEELKRKLENRGGDIFLLLHLLNDPEDPYTFALPDFKPALTGFNEESLARLVVQTDGKYGNGIIEQLSIPEPNKIPLHLSLVNMTSYVSPAEPSLLYDESKRMDDESRLTIFSGIQKSELFHVFALDESAKENAVNYLHNSAVRFIVKLFTSVQIVVDGPIVDSATMNIHDYNSRLITEGKQHQEMKNCSEICYRIRSRRFPSFPFLRMTTQRRVFHISVISEQESQGSSLLSWLTGIGFSTMKKNTLAIGSNVIPVFNRNYDIIDETWRINEDSISDIINVVGSLFTIEQGTFTQVVGFISALSASDTIIIEFEEIQDILEFFRKFFDSCDSICSEFNIKLPGTTKPNTNEDDTNNDNDNDNENGNENGNENKKESKKVRSNVNVAIFCNSGSNPSHTLQIIKNEVFSLIEERCLNSEDSIAAKAVENIRFTFLPQTPSISEKINRLRNAGFIDATSATIYTKDFISSLRDMSLIFGQQVDHEANQSCFKEKRGGGGGGGEYIPFVVQDEDSSKKEELFGLANKILKKSLGDSESKKLANHLLEESSKQGNIKAWTALYYEQNKGHVNYEEIIKYLDNAIKNGSEEAVVEKCRIMNTEEYIKKYKEDIIVRQFDDYLNRYPDNNQILYYYGYFKYHCNMKRRDIDERRKISALNKYCESYKKGERESSPKEILNILNELMKSRSKLISASNYYTGLEILLDEESNAIEIQDMFNLIPSEERTNFELNMRIFDKLKRS